MTLLSILIPAIPEIETKFRELLAEITKQVNDFSSLHWEFIRDHGEIEIITDKSKSFLIGGLSIGAKRQSLIQKSNGKYFAFIDGDDCVAPNYVETIVRLCARDKDAVSFRCLFKNDHYWTVIDMSLHHRHNEDASPHKIVKRKLWHVCAIKRELAVSHAFSELNHNEDWDWMERVIPNIRSEAHTTQILTQYNHSSANSEADKIIQAGHK